MQHLRISPSLSLVTVSTSAIWLLAWYFGGTTSGWDVRLFSALRPEQRSGVAELAWAITWLGDWIVLVPLSLAASAFLLWRRRRVEALFLLGTTAAVRVLVTLQKLWFDRSRPDVEQWMVEYSQSFPSAHAANSAATFLALAIILTSSRIAVAVAIALSFLVGLSRVILGVHWPTDVIGGWAFAALATLPLWKFWESRQVQLPSGK